jgi:hypothetical protein
MPRWLQITGIGCGGLLGLFILLGVVGIIVGGGETATETNPAQSEQTELEEARKEAAQARREAKTAKEEAAQANEQAAQAEEAKAEATANEESASPEGNDDAGNEASQPRPPEDVLALQYEHINAGDYEAAYDLFAEQSKQLVSLEEYRAWFENAGNYQVTSFSLPTSQVEGDTATLVADLVATSDAFGEEQYQATQEMQLENESWRVVMRDEQVATFAGANSEPSAGEENAEEESSESEVVVRVTGDPGIQFQGNIGNIDSSRSVEGTIPAEFPVDVDQGFFSGDVVSANAQNMGGAGNLTVQIVNDGEVVKESSTSAEYGIAQVSWVPGE